MEQLFENWSETKAALLEGLSSRKQEIVAPLLENQKNHLLVENAAGGTGVTQAHDIAGFRKILIPMIRRIIPGTIATELVGVQPMSGPVGLVYTLRYRYAETVTGDATRNPFGAPNAVAPNDEVFGNVSPIRSFYSGAVDAGGSPAYAGEAAGASGVEPGYTGAPGDITAATAQGRSWPSSMPATDTAGDPADGYPSFGPHADPGSALEAATNSNGDRAADYFRSVAGTLRGGSGSWLEGSGGRKLTLDVVSQAVEAGSRKLQAGWTTEAMQDLNAQHGLNLETEITQALSAEIVQEIDYEIISDLLALAGTVENFDGSGAGQYSWNGGAGNYAPAYVGDRLANIGVVINRVANEIGRKTRRGTANFMVVSPLMVSVLQSAAKSVFAPAVEGSFKGPNNTMMVGTLNGTIKVYSYLWNQAGAGLNLAGAGSPGNSVDDIMLLGYKGGNGETDTGYFYCPYIPLMSSGVIVHPTTFQPVVSLMTRYGKAVFVNNQTSLGNSSDYYGKIHVDALDLR